MEPSAEVIAGFQSVDSVFAWTGIAEAAAAAFKGSLGADGTEHPRIIGNMKDDEFEAAVLETRIGSAELARVQKSQCRLIGRICRAACGVEKSQAQMAEALAAKEKQAEGMMNDAIAIATEARGVGS